MKTCIFVPPLGKMTGGLAVLFQLADKIMRSGFEVSLVPRESGRPLWPSRLTPLITPWENLNLQPGDLWIVPEGWVNALAFGLHAKARCLVYVQNWAYLFSSLPPGVCWHDLDVSFVSVSRPVAWFVKQSLGKDSPVLPPAIDTRIFSPDLRKPAHPLRVAFMPRKNKALAEMIRSVWEARNAMRSRPLELTWLEIHGQSQSGVARLLQTAHIFLSTGFPEGFALPPLEAMACGCVPVGFTGLGGWEYMTQVHEHGWKPWWPVPESKWPGNGFWVPDGDVLAAALALEQAVDLWNFGGEQLHSVLAAGARTVQAFSSHEQLERVTKLWTTLARKAS